MGNSFVDPVAAKYGPDTSSWELAKSQAEIKREKWIDMQRQILASDTRIDPMQGFAIGLMNMLPALVGYAAGGNEGGAIGSKISMENTGNYFKGLQDEEDKKDKQNQLLSSTFYEDYKSARDTAEKEFSALTGEKNKLNTLGYEYDQNGVPYKGKLAIAGASAKARAEDLGAAFGGITGTPSPGATSGPKPANPAVTDKSQLVPGTDTQIEGIGPSGIPLNPNLQKSVQGFDEQATMERSGGYDRNGNLLRSPQQASVTTAPMTSNTGAKELSQFLPETPAQMAKVSQGEAPIVTFMSDPQNAPALNTPLEAVRSDEYSLPKLTEKLGVQNMGQALVAKEVLTDAEKQQKLYHDAMTIKGLDLKPPPVTVGQEIASGKQTRDLARMAMEVAKEVSPEAIARIGKKFGYDLGALASDTPEARYNAISSAIQLQMAKKINSGRPSDKDFAILDALVSGASMDSPQTRARTMAMIYSMSLSGDYDLLNTLGQSGVSRTGDIWNGVASGAEQDMARLKEQGFNTLPISDRDAFIKYQKRDYPIFANDANKANQIAELQARAAQLRQMLGGQ